MEDKEKWMQETFKICEYCGYNNPRERFEGFGTCLRCKKVLDEKVYFRAQMKKVSRKKPVKQRTNGVLSF